MDQQSLKALARKYRPQRFADVVGQQAVTTTLENALRHNRLAQAFIFAGPRGVGKTTTARILARALNCEQGPAVEPCGHCDPCREIAAGRDMDVLEIDAASNTGVDDVRNVIIQGLSIPPARDRYKVFIIDEVHQLSKYAFNALLKSIEEPPPYVIFIMATTELDRVIDTILSRSQVFEFRTISTTAIADQLAAIVAAEHMDVDPQALLLIARSAAGSMRDAETALDQVRSFAGDQISVQDVSDALGLIGRDLPFAVVEAVADERATSAFELAAKAVEYGYDLRLLCQELSRLVRDLLVLSVDPSRIDDPDIAPDAERQRLRTLAARFSREDLLRAFDLLTRAEYDIRNAAEPKYHLEMLILRWIHARKLTPLTEIIDRLQQGGDSTLPGGGGTGGGSRASVPAAPRAPVAPRATAAPRAVPGPRPPSPRPVASPAAVEDDEDPAEPPSGRGAASLKDLLLDEIKRTKAVFYRMVVAQASRIDVEPGTVAFGFAPAHRLLGEQVQQNRSWLEAMAEKISGRNTRVVVSDGDGGNGGAGNGNGGTQGRSTSPSRDIADSTAPGSTPRDANNARDDLRARVMAHEGFKALSQVFPVEILDVEEI